MEKRGIDRKWWKAIVMLDCHVIWHWFYESFFLSLFLLSLFFSSFFLLQFFSIHYDFNLIVFVYDSVRLILFSLSLFPHTYLHSLTCTGTHKPLQLSLLSFLFLSISRSIFSLSFYLSLYRFSFFLSLSLYRFSFPLSLYRFSFFLSLFLRIITYILPGPLALERAVPKGTIMGETNTAKEPSLFKEAVPTSLIVLRRIFAYSKSTAPTWEKKQAEKK